MVVVPQLCGSDFNLRCCFSGAQASMSWSGWWAGRLGRGCLLAAAG